MFDSYIVNTYKSELTEIKKASDRYKEAEEKFYKAKSPTEIKKYWILNNRRNKYV